MKEVSSAAREDNKRIGLRLLPAFLLPVCLVCVIMARKGIVPFGDIDVFIWDAKLQHKDYLGYVIDILHGRASLQYSASKALGGGIPGILGFYASSPLNLLLFFFSKEQIPLFMSLIIILRTGLCGLTSGFYLCRRFRLPFFAFLSLSTAYALSEYNVYYCRNCMWLDGVILLPLAAYGVWQYVKEKKRAVLTAALFLSIVSNWYTGYMVCLMTGILFFVEYFLNMEGRFSVRAFGRVFGGFMVTAVSGVLLSAFALVPYCAALVGGKATNNIGSFNRIVNYGILHFFSGFNIQAPVNRSDAPILYCTALVLLLTVCFFFSRGIAARKKIVMGAACGLMAVSFCLHPAELLWTAFIESHSYYYRFAFVVPMLMIMIGGMVLENMADTAADRTAVVKALVFLAAVFLILRYTGNWSGGGTAAVLYPVCFLIYGVLLFTGAGYSKKQWFRAGGLLVAAVCVCAELFYNTGRAFSDYRESAAFFAEYAGDMEALTDALAERSGQDFYRFEKNVSYNSLTGSPVATCESMLFGYYSMEHYSSAYDIQTDHFLSAMGYADWVNEADVPCETYWNSPMTAMEALLSVRYILWDAPVWGYRELSDISVPFEGQHLYENEYVLPLGCNADQGAGRELEYGRDPFENQQVFLSALAGRDTVLYHGNECRLTAEDPEAGTEIWQIRMNTDGPAWVFIDGEDIHGSYRRDNCRVTVNGKEERSCQRFCTSGIYLGEYKEGDTAVVEIRHESGDEGVHRLYSAVLDTEQFAELAGQLKSGSASDLKLVRNRLSGTYETEEDTLVFLSVPFEKNWSIRVDGSRVRPECIGNTFLGIPLSAGSHEIDMVYTAPGVRAGGCVSLVALAGLLICLLRRKRAGREAAEKSAFTSVRSDC